MCIAFGPSVELQKILQALVDSTRRANGELLTFTTFVRYDETPIKLVTIDSSTLWGLPEEFLTFHSCAQDCRDLVQQALRDKAPTKLLQTVYRFGALIKLDRKFRFFFFKFSYRITSSF